MNKDKRLSTNSDINVGDILVAIPLSTDESIYIRTVILIVEHGHFGTIGFIINKHMEIEVNDTLDDFPECNSILVYGGPWGDDLIHFIHTVGMSISGSREIVPGIYWDGNLEVIKILIESGRITKENIVFVAGSTQWEPGQLREEIDGGLWIKMKITPEMKMDIFSEDRRTMLWEETLRGLGGNYAVYANFPNDPSEN